MVRCALRRFALPALLAASCVAAQAQDVRVSRAWVRATVAGQTATGAYMTIDAGENLKLVGVASPAAKLAEIHQMTMSQGVMRMHPMAALDLPAGKPVELTPGGYHIMLIGIARQLKPGDSVPLQLKLEDRNRTVRTLEVKAEVRPLTAGRGGERNDGQGDGHGRMH